jgi:hypothetical protein
MDAIRNATPVPPSEHCLPGLISGALDQVVLKALAKRPADRHASADAFALALEEAIHAPSELDRTIMVAPADAAAPVSGSATGVGRATGSGQTAALAARKASPLPWILGGGAAVVAAGVGLTFWLLSAGPTPIPIVRPADPPVAPTVVASGPGTSGGEVSPTRPPGEVLGGMPNGTPSGTPSGTPVAVPPSVPVDPAKPPVAAPAAPPATTQPVIPQSATAPPVVATPVSPPVTVPPVVATPAPPVVTPEPPPPAAPTLADLRALVAAADCAIIGGALEPGRMVLNGLGARDLVTPLRALWTTLRDAAPPNAASRFDVTSLARGTGICEALGLVRPFAEPLGSARRPVSVRVDANGPRLVPDVGFSLSVGMPDFAGWIQVDYFSFADNAVLHIGLSAPRVARHPTPLPQAIPLNAAETALVFNGSAGSPGEDLVIAIASRERLFAQPRPEIEDATAYLAALRAALEGRAPGSVAAHAIPVIIQPPP